MKCDDIECNLFGGSLCRLQNDRAEECAFYRPKKKENELIKQYQALADAVDQVVECAAPIDSDEYAVDGEAYQQMFDCLVALKADRKTEKDRDE